MKHILAPILIALTFSVMFSSTSFAGWTKVSESAEGRIYYVDFERIRKHGGYVYWWELADYLKPDKYGTLSAKVYNQGDCKLFRVNRLSLSFRKEPMGRGTGGEYTPPEKWIYPSPNSSMEVILKSVCGH
jgi:hypothetical protein